MWAVAVAPYSRALIHIYFHFSFQFCLFVHYILLTILWNWPISRNEAKRKIWTAWWARAYLNSFCLLPSIWMYWIRNDVISYCHFTSSFRFFYVVSFISTSFLWSTQFFSIDTMRSKNGNEIHNNLSSILGFRARKAFITFLVWDFSNPNSVCSSKFIQIKCDAGSYLLSAIQKRTNWNELSWTWIVLSFTFINNAIGVRLQKQRDKYCNLLSRNSNVIWRVWFFPVMTINRSWGYLCLWCERIQNFDNQ